jgi:small GTP-binding protein
MSEEYDYLFKTVVIGDGGVGKTALTLRFSKGFFQEKYKMTIGVDFHVKTIKIESDNGDIRVKLQIWDTGGQERFSSIRPMYYRGALGALLIFDLTSTSSFEHLPQWIEEVRANCKEDIPLLLVGNKDDLVDQRMVALEEINEFTKEFNLFYMETSAKTGDNVGDCFYVLACLMVGEGVPEKLIGEDIIYAPGKIPITKKEETLIPPEEVKATEYEESPIQEPILEPEPELEYETPPIPEPETMPEIEVEYEAPPIPEPDTTPETEPKYEIPSISESEPESAPETELEYETPQLEEIPNASTAEPSAEKPTEFEFKTPEELLAENTELQQEAAEISSISESSRPPEYKPKSIPFSSSSPIPTKGPQEFTSEQIGEKTETPAQQYQEPPKKESKSLYDYFPSVVEPEPEKQVVEKEPEVKTPSLFETLSQKKSVNQEQKSSAFIPFYSSVDQESTETIESTFEAIPSVEDIESNEEIAESKEEPAKKGKSGVIICPNCGATLSSDYMFCNKCGTKLNNNV